jgi:hypothetical protein
MVNLLFEYRNLKRKIIVEPGVTKLHQAFLQWHANNGNELSKKYQLYKNGCVLLILCYPMYFKAQLKVNNEKMAIDLWHGYMRGCMQAK